MTDRTKIGLAFILVSMGLLSCSNRPPDCGNPETLQLLRQIILEQLSPDHPAAKLTDAELADKLVFTLPRATSYEKEIKKFSCVAHLSAPFLDEDDNAYHGDIAYESQLNDSSEHIGVINNLAPGDIFLISSALSSNLNSGNKIAPSAQTQSVVEEAASVKADDYEEAPQEAETQVDPVQTDDVLVAQPETRALPSFDCSKATTVQERLICSSSELSIADLKLAQAYKNTLNSASDKTALKQGQNEWRKNMRDVCTSIDCIASAYAHRISELEQAP